MSALKILVVEDDWLIGEDLKSRLESRGYEVLGPAASMAETIDLLDANEAPDLAFMDIKLAGNADGIDTALALKSRYDIPVIFLSSLDDPAILKRAMHIGPANYLLKPFDERQLFVSIEQALHTFSGGDLTYPAETQRDGFVQEDTLFIMNRQGVFKKYLIDDILYIQAHRSYCQLFTKTGDCILQASSMNNVTSRINRSEFRQIHRSFVVNLRNIDGIKGNSVLIGVHQLPIGPQYKQEFLRVVNILK